MGYISHRIKGRQTDTDTHTDTHTDTQTQVHTEAHMHTDICGQSNFKKSGVRRPVAGTCLA